MQNGELRAALRSTLIFLGAGLALLSPQGEVFIIISLQKYLSNSVPMDVSFSSLTFFGLISLIYIISAVCSAFVRVSLNKINHQPLKIFTVLMCPLLIIPLYNAWAYASELLKAADHNHKTQLSWVVTMWFICSAYLYKTAWDYMRDYFISLTSHIKRK